MMIVSNTEGERKLVRLQRSMYFGLAEDGGPLQDGQSRGCHANILLITTPQGNLLLSIL